MKWTLKTWEERTIAYLDRLLGFPREKRRFLKAHGYPLNLQQPRTFNEKLCWKKIYDRNPVLPVIADKLRVRDYIRNQLGSAEAEDVLIPLLQVMDVPEALDLDALPEQFVIKSNHGSGHNWLVRSKAEFTMNAFVELAEKWLKAPYGDRNHEWAYQQIPRKILVEPLLQDDAGHIPADYKFSMMNGRCVFVQVDQDRYGEFTRSLFSPDWQWLDVAWKRKQGPDLPKPANLERMLALAAQLAKPFDYIRVDFYSLGARVYIGELTNYPARGRGRITPSRFDEHWGAQLQLAGLS
ncbi:MAG: ATP-grasp fold amidoligase family protein [Saccharospirillum sp.]